MIARNGNGSLSGSVVVDESYSGQRLDRCLQILLEAQLGVESPSRSQLTAWIEHGYVTVNSQPATKAGVKTKTGMVVELTVPPPVGSPLLADQTVPFRVSFEDDHLLVIDKPAGVVVHPGAGRQTGTLVNGLLFYLGENIRSLGDPLRPGIVHRLDRETSGLMVVAKSDRVLRALATQLRPPRRMSRVYSALVYRLPRKCPGSVLAADGCSGTIDLPIARHPTIRTKMAVGTAEQGRASKTEWQIAEAFESINLLKLTLFTGRTHQIRVHLSAVGAPIVGDPIYGGAPPVRLPAELLAKVRVIKRQALHASSLAFDHPVTGERISINSPLPADMSELLQALREIR